MTELRDRVLSIVVERGHEELDDPVQLSSGELSSHFVDAKKALARGTDLALACRALLERVELAGIEFDAVGGLTLGADQFAHGAAIVGDKDWFVVRKARKGRGTNKLVEGAELSSGVRVLLVDDIVTTGGSIRQAYEAIGETGAEVVAAVTLVDRGDSAVEFFAEVGVPYFPLLTYQDLEIPPVGYGLEELEEKAPTG
ncbi:MAG: orotate phosphoribosyltransferase [Actinomycetota bacterium]|nr:orotate phosphoribosyltransferase [Actinomycetota bacterium]